VKNVFFILCFYLPKTGRALSKLFLLQIPGWRLNEGETGEKGEKVAPSDREKKKVELEAAVKEEEKHEEVDEDRAEYGRRTSRSRTSM
jgi:hypothetical protein